MKIMNTANNFYEKDLFAWTETQVNLLKNKEFEKLDLINIIEEIESLGTSTKRSLSSHLKTFFLHKLKTRYQPEFDCTSWKNSIRNSLEDLKEILNDNPSLKSYLNECLNKSYERARNDAIAETGLSERIFPNECPWKLEEIL